MSGNQDEANGAELPDDLQPPEQLGREEGVEIEGPDIPFALDEFLVEGDDGDLRVEVEIGGRRRTVDLREPRAFEDKLIDNITEDKPDKSRRGANIPIKGPWIHGWLINNGSDYIASIFRNYQFFLKYVEGVTKRRQNAGTVHRAPGTYDSMYTYLLILEKLGLVERFRREEIPEDEFDHPVPDEFQDRTFVRVTTKITEAEEEWRNPFKAQYPEHFDEDFEPGDVEEDEPEEITTPEPQEQPEEPDEPEEEQIDEEPSDEETGLQNPEEIDTVDDFSNPSGIVAIIDEAFDEALQETINDPPVTGADEGIEPEQFSRGRVAVWGVWTEGDATPGQDRINMLVELINESAPRNARYIPDGLSTRLETEINLNNPAPEFFNTYKIDVVFSEGFNNAIDKRVVQTQDLPAYYELTQEEFVDV